MISLQSGTEGSEDPSVFSIIHSPTKDNSMLPSYNAIQFHSKEEHRAALYDACLLIVNTYNGSDLLDGYTVDNYKHYVSPYDFMKFARNVLNQISEGN
jgi:hypothetical protein